MLQRQQSSGKYFLVLQGNFYRAYNDAAFALHRVTGYKVFQKQGAGGEAYYQLGFNMKQIDDVIAKIEQQAGKGDCGTDEERIQAPSGAGEINILLII